MIDIKQYLASWKEPLAWTGASLVFFLLCLVLTFPTDTLHQRILSEVERASGVRVHATNYATGFPLAMEWRHVTITSPSWPSIEMGKIHAQAGLLKAMGGELLLDLQAQLDAQSLDHGVLATTISSPSWATTGPLTIRGTLKQVDLSKLAPPYIQHGALTGTFAHRLDTPQAFTTGDIHWTFEAQELTLEHLPLANGRMLSVSFNALSLDLSCEAGHCTVKELKGDGPEGSFTITGTLALQQVLPESRLDLSLTITPGSGFAAKAADLGIPPLPGGRPMTVKVAGTLAQPRITL